MPTPDFILRLREHVGHAELWLPGVTAIVTDDADRLLLGRRADTGEWALVSGILEPGEEPALGLAREIAEETGVEARAVALVAVDSDDAVSYPNGDRTRFLNLTFAFRHVSGTAHVADEESLDVAWFDLRALPEPLAASTAHRLAQWEEFRRDPARGALFVA